MQIETEVAFRSLHIDTAGGDGNVHAFRHFDGVVRYA
jgi:hypothetical protein